MEDLKGEGNGNLLARLFYSAVILLAGVLVGAIGELLAAGWIIAIPIVIVLFWRPARSILTTHEFTAVTMLVLALFTAVGTFAPVGSIYASAWFVSVLAFLGTASFLCFVQRLPKRGSFAFSLVHLAVVVVLVGSGLKAGLQVEGYVELVEGQSTGRYLVLRDGKLAGSGDLPFEIRLDDFHVEFHEAKRSVQVFKGVGKKPAAILDLDKQQEARIEGSTVKAVGVTTQQFQPPMEGHPPVKLEVAQVELDGQTGYLFPDQPVRAGNLILQYSLKQDPKVYSSQVSLLDEDGDVLQQGSVVVNDPMIEQGWWVYQSNWDPKNLAMSGFQVVKDPGIWVVFVGLIMGIIGVLLKIAIPLRRRES